MEQKKKKYFIAGRSLRMPGLKATDFYLFQQEKEFFDMDMRALVTLGLRFIYSGWHREDCQDMLRVLATQIHAEDLDAQEEFIHYTPLRDIVPSPRTEARLSMPARSETP